MFDKSCPKISHPIADPAIPWLAADRTFTSYQMPTGAGLLTGAEDFLRFLARSKPDHHFIASNSTDD